MVGRGGSPIMTVTDNQEKLHRRNDIHVGIWGVKRSEQRQGGWESVTSGLAEGTACAKAGQGESMAPREMGKHGA